MTNKEGRRVQGTDRSQMDLTDLRGYLGRLILAGVFRSSKEATEHLWQELLCPQHAGVHGQTSWWAAREEPEGGAADDRGSEGTHHHGGQFLHLLFPWPGAPVVQTHHGGNSEAE